MGLRACHEIKGDSDLCLPPILGLVVVIEHSISDRPAGGAREGKELIGGREAATTGAVGERCTFHSVLMVMKKDM